MCIAIVKTKDGKITDEQLKNCFENNPDGAGVAWTEEGVLWYIKGIFDVKDFIESVRHAESKADGAMLIHCRISTSGLVDETNCHPHVVNNNCVMIHNGVLKNITVPKDSKVSDTVLFVTGVLSKLPKDFMFDEGIMNLIEVAIGGGNKFCFLHSNGQYAIANEDAGEWVDGVWFSNDSYEDRYTRYYGNGYYSHWYDEEYSYPNYKDYRETKEEEFLTGTDWLNLERYINGLGPEELLEIGPDPVYSRVTKTLMNDYVFTEDRDFTEDEDYLSDVSDYLYEIYEEQYQAACDMYTYEVNEDDTELVEQ